jgi:protein phosphatase
VSAETPVHLPGAAQPNQRPHAAWRWRGGLQAAYASEAGYVHARNEDCCGHFPTAERPQFCGVADGVGGGAHGDIASSVLLEHCARAPGDYRRDPGRLADWLTQADETVRAAISRRSRHAGAATLAAAWFPSPGLAYVVNVGDCRAYRLRPTADRNDGNGGNDASGGGYTIERLTVDQTYASLDETPPPQGRPEDPARMVGAGAVGTPPVVKADLHDSDLLMLCSDGLHKFLSDRAIAERVAQGMRAGQPLQAICAALVRAARAAGSRDDASALLVWRRGGWNLGLGWRWASVSLLAVLLIWLVWK